MHFLSYLWGQRAGFIYMQRSNILVTQALLIQRIHPNASTRVSQPFTNEDLVIATVGDDNTIIIWQYTEDVGVVPIAYSLSSRGVEVGLCKRFT